MSLQRTIVVIAAFVALTSYWAYCPLPPGYSFASTGKFQIAMAILKTTEIVSRIGSFLGFGSHTEIFRKLFSFGPHSVVEGIETREMDFDGVPVRIYRPSGTLNETLPGIVYYHGGGWTFGSIDTVDMITRDICKNTRSVVASVEYRLGPEFPFPAAFDDSTAAAKYFMEYAADFYVDPQRIALAGDSAGGNLATTVSLKLRDEKFPIPIKLQILIYPVTQGVDFDLPSMLLHRDGPFLTREMMTFFTAMYIDGSEDHISIYNDNNHVPKAFRQKIEKTFLNIEKLPKEFLVGYERPPYPEGDEGVWNKIKDKMTNPYYSPFFAENLENLPEAYVFTANYDPLRDEGWLYGLRLKEAKNKVTMYNAENGFHPLANFVGVFPEADEMFAQITKFIKDRL